MVAGDAERVDSLVPVAYQPQSVHPDRLPAVPAEDVEPLVRWLVVVARHDSVRVARHGAVEQAQAGEWPWPVPWLCGSSQKARSTGKSNYRPTADTF